MAKRVSISSLNASTLDILNTIRQNASAQYQDSVPAISDVRDIPKVGDVLMGYPNLANQFLEALINRIALVRVKSANFNNMYADLKKGYLEYGETVEEVFVNIAKAREFSPEKAKDREFKRTLPDVRSAFHAMNWRVQYPITIQDEDLRTAFVSAEGVTDLIARIVDAVYTASEYDEFLLFKYLIIKAVAHGKMYPIGIDMTTFSNTAESFRGTSNLLQFMSPKYNASGVHTVTAKEDQCIFMDSMFNAKYDVNVLASAFNMDKAMFMGNLKLIDDWTTFDNDRWDVIRSGSDMVENVTADELSLMANVKAVMVDREWFQVYDNSTKFTEDYVASGMYWNYFLNIWKTVSSSPFSNAIVFVDNTADTSLPSSVVFEVTDKIVNENGTIITLSLQEEDGMLNGGQYNFIQNQGCTTQGIAVHKYGAIIIPSSATAQKLTVDIGGNVYQSVSVVADTVDVGDEIEFGNSTVIENTVESVDFGDNVTITPDFAKGTTTYTGTATDDGELEFTLTNPVATAVVKLGSSAITPVSGVYTIEFVEGSNTVTIAVTGTSGTKTYTFTITKS